MRYRSLFLLSLSAGCMDHAQLERHDECVSLCNRTNEVCNDFVLEECISYCTNLPSMEEVEEFHICAECYVAVYCDANTYRYICYPSCEGLE
jgi:hypothetical protein